MNIRQWMARAGFLSMSGGILFYGFITGVTAFKFRIDLMVIVLVVVLLQAIVSSLIFAVGISLSGVLFFIKLFISRLSVESCIDSGRVVAVVPVYRDAEALDRSVRSLLSSNYQDLAIRIVCESNDPASRRRAETFADHENVDVLINTHQPGSKSGAINHAVKTTESEYIAVFDADERVDLDFIGHAVAKLDSHDVVQGRTVPQPTGAIEALAYYESVLLSYVTRRLLYLLTGFRMASSRAIVMRRAAIESVDGYDPEMLTEDFDFAYRCYKERLDVRETLAYPSRIDAAHNPRDWWGQRKRWMTGYAQVLRRLTSEIDVKDYRSVLSTVICGSTVIGSVLMLSLLSKFAVLLLVGAETWFLPPVVAVFGVTFAVRLHDVWTGAVDGFDLYWLLLPWFFPLYGLSAIKATFEYLFTWNGGWYSVEKN